MQKTMVLVRWNMVRLVLMESCLVDLIDLLVCFPILNVFWLTYMIRHVGGCTGDGG
jgi:hypothetical protein